MQYADTAFVGRGWSLTLAAEGLMGPPGGLGAARLKASLQYKYSITPQNGNDLKKDIPEKRKKSCKKENTQRHLVTAKTINFSYNRQSIMADR